jgi:hypothetical protein
VRARGHGKLLEIALESIFFDYFFAWHFFTFLFDPFLLIPCETLFFLQTFKMKSPKERHQADREWVGGATPF